MGIENIWSWMAGRKNVSAESGQRGRRRRFSPRLTRLEERTVPAGYLAIGSGQGAPPLVAIRCDIVDALNGPPPNPAGQPAPPTSDGRTDVTSQVFAPYDMRFLGGVRTASGNFDGDATTPDQLITAAGPTGGPHVIMWDMVQAADGKITVLRKRAEFMAYDIRFTGGVNVTTGDLDGDGRAELITAPAGQGGPHVKIWKFDLNTNRFFVANEFMAFETTFTGGVNIASGQGYQAPFQVRQVLSAQLPTSPTFGSTFSVVPYFPASSAPGAALGIPLVSGSFFLGIGSNTPDPANVPLNLPYFSVAGGVFQFGSANLLNNLGNITNTPNVIDPLGLHRVPPEQPLVMANWAANDPNIPPWAIPTVNYGPFVQVSPPLNGAPAVITRLRAPPGQPNFRNQLVITPGVGGGPIVKVFDFMNGANGLQQDAMILFNAFADDPNLVNSRTGLKVAIGNVIDNPIPITIQTANGPVRRVISNVTTPELGDTGTQFPYSTNYYRQGSAQIIVSQASGGRFSRIFADFNPINPVTRAPTRRTSINELQLVPVQIGTTTVFDPNNWQGNFQTATNFDTFDRGVDPQFVGTVNNGVSHLALGLTLNADGTFTVGNPRGANLFAAGPSSSAPNRGPRVHTFDHMGPNVTFIPDGFNPDGRPLPPTSPIFSGGNTPYVDPIDDFSAFTGAAGLFGASSVSFGFGALPTQRLVTLELPPITIQMINNPVLLEGV